MKQGSRWTARLSVGLALSILIVALYNGFHHTSSVDRRHLAYRSVESALTTVESDDTSLVNGSQLMRRDDYTCSASKPCRNGACCGASGYCGYGPTYCGDGCVSQCSATAECGQYASQPGKKCPLNVCCSQFGFCGTTTDFCDSKCQSNCNEHPSPPGGVTGKVFDKVIGYYESWSSNKACHKVSPFDLPLDALTHVNYAFAYISPGSYEITTMDSATPGSLFDETTTLKSIKPDLEVWVSIGGWTFSDNGTATQPLFGEIAADAGKRQTFANNLVHFMQQHGFDGVDLDWEYPGAPDRGGHEDDTENYVKLLQTMRSIFDSSSGKYGITFTAPSSFWYLRWFDLPGLLKYADWINFMTYDLHGVWDSTNPIGSIVQGHTNLTEIKLATELLWRVDVPPVKVSLGVGFYGRSFTLADTGCTKPGCPFSGASLPGPCTATGGYLGWYEIQQVLKSGAKPVHDTTAAVNYLTFDNNQWISYDDSVTFKQKADWANSVGLGGSLIWASDLDDDQYSAHSALLGRKIASTSSLQNTQDLLHQAESLSLVGSIKGQTGENCFVYDDKCVDLNDNQAMASACGSANTVVGWDDAGCGKKNHHYGKPVCCPKLGAPTTCTWRGDNTGGVGGDCSGECYEGEINVAGIGSSWGGGFTNDGNTNKCRRGYKSFCCVAPDYNAITKTCSFSDCGKGCPSGQTAEFQYYSDCWFGRTKTYCCPDPSPINQCHWVGDGGDCANVHCAKNEIEIARDPYGDPNEDSWACSWGRDKAACCQIGQIPLEPATCSTDICKAIPGYCDSAEDEDDNDDNSDTDDGSSPSRRDVSFSEDEEGGWHALSKRGKSHNYFPVSQGGPNIKVTSVPYPGPSKIYTSRLGFQAIPFAFRLFSQYCAGPALQALSVPLPPPLSIIRNGGFDTEHVIDRQVIAYSFVVSMFTGILPSGTRSSLSKVGQSFFNQWNTNLAAFKNFGRIGDPKMGPRPITINKSIMTCLGGWGFEKPFSLLQKSVNIAKGNVMGLKAPVALDKIRGFAQDIVKLDTKQSADVLFSAIREGFAVFEYFRNPQVSQAWNAVNTAMRTQLGVIEQVTGVTNLVDWWDEWLADFSETVALKAQKWAEDAIEIVTDVITEANKQAAARGAQALTQTASIVAELEDFSDEIAKMVTPGLNQIPLPGTPGSGTRRRDVWGDGEGQQETIELDQALWDRLMAMPDPADVKMVLHPHRNVSHGHGHGHGHGHARRGYM